MGDIGNQDLLVVWTSRDREVALNMVFMYAGNARKHGWWASVTMLVWGPSQKLLTEDQELQEQMAAMVERGVRFVACKACADSYGIAEELEALGVKVFYTGQFLTEWLRSEASVATF